MASCDSSKGWLPGCADAELVAPAAILHCRRPRVQAPFGVLQWLLTCSPLYADARSLSEAALRVRSKREAPVEYKSFTMRATCEAV